MRCFNTKNIIPRLLLTFAISWCFLFTIKCHAVNEHEHFQYLPSYDDFLNAGFSATTTPANSVGSGATFRGIIGKDTTIELLKNNTYSDQLLPHSKIGTSFSEKELDQIFQKYLQGKNLSQVANDIAKIRNCSPDLVLRGFFELNSFHALADRGTAYHNIGIIRTRIMQEMRHKIPVIVNSYLNRNKITNFQSISLSVPPSLYSKDVLQPLQQAVAARGGNFNFYLTFARNGGTQEALQRGIEQVSQSLQHGWGHGIDIVGSIAEIATEPLDIKVIGLYRQRFDAIAHALQNQGSLRIHAFEAARSGNFYEALWDFLESRASKGQLPKEIRIGHINALSEQDITRFSLIQKKSHKPIFIIFEASIESNLLLHPGEKEHASIRRLKNIIEQIHYKGMRVSIGSDGQGILGKSSQWEQVLVSLRNAGLKEQNLVQLINETTLSISEKNKMISKLGLRPSLRQMKYCLRKYF